jgi:catechol-2,3-dioxygenase
MMRSGAVFLRTQRLAEIVEFYRAQVGCAVWMDQGGCVILCHGSFLLGFCQGDTAQTEGILTFVYAERADVDRMYEAHRATAEAAPCDNPRYPIYNFFARDPEGRRIEFQVFTNDPDWDAVSIGECPGEPQPV